MWAKIDDSAPDHFKFIQAGKRLGPDGRLLAFGFFVSGVCFSNRHLTDGYLPLDVVETWSKRAGTLASALVSVGLWDRADGGFQIHDFHDYNPASDEVQARREKDRARKETERRERLGLKPRVGVPRRVRTESERSPQGHIAESERSPEFRAPAGASTVPGPARPDHVRDKNGGAGAPRFPQPVEKSPGEPEEPGASGPEIPEIPEAPTRRRTRERPKVRTIAAVIRREGIRVDVFDGHDEGDIVEEVKSWCANYQVPYDRESVNKAIDSERVKRKHRGFKPIESANDDVTDADLDRTA
ncbi:hypothetical protein LLG88_13465 [bacterium]|nr:hypothetical protein [bacterium]